MDIYLLACFIFVFSSLVKLAIVKYVILYYFCSKGNSNDNSEILQRYSKVKPVGYREIQFSSVDPSSLIVRLNSSGSLI